MKMISAIGKLLSGILAVASGIFTLVLNDISIALYDSMPNFIQPICIIVVFILGLFLMFASIWDFIGYINKMKYKHKLNFQSKQFVNFFSDWYSAPGTLYVICDDIDWTKNDENQNIYNALLDKSKDGKLNLFLGDRLDSKLVEKLKKNGANVYKAPKSIVEKYTFSCLSVMGNTASRTIVRNKQNDEPGVVIFEEINNTYINGLLDELLRWREADCNTKK